MRTILLSAGTIALFAGPVQSHDGPEPHPNTYEAPIAGIQNDYWFDYRTDLAEAESELVEDLERATDAEDRNDAWREYVREIADANDDYSGEMAERGYRSGLVTVGD